jgi:hypothetical protein
MRRHRRDELLRAHPNWKHANTDGNVTLNIDPGMPGIRMRVAGNDLAEAGLSSPPQSTMTTSARTIPPSSSRTPIV